MSEHRDRHRSRAVFLASLCTVAWGTPQNAETQTALQRSCAHILASGRSTGSGVYLIDPDGNGGAPPFNVHCDMTTDGGGWTLVVHHNDQDCWMTGDSDLRPDHSYGNYEPDPLSPANFYMNFSSLAFDEFLFAWGDYDGWLVTPKTSIYSRWCDVGCHCSVPITASTCDTQHPATFTWCLRIGVGEDPWVSLGDHFGGCGFSSTHCDHEGILYGEGTDLCCNVQAKNSHRGANVFVRLNPSHTPFERFDVAAMSLAFVSDNSALANLSLAGGFVIDSVSDGVYPLQEDVILKVGTLAVTLPAGSLEPRGRAYEFIGVVGGAKVSALIEEVESRVFGFVFQVKSVEMQGNSTPLPVALSIGGDGGETVEHLTGRLSKRSGLVVDGSSPPPAPMAIRRGR